MTKDANDTIAYVIGPDGQKLTIFDLPSPDTKRWVSRRKAEVVAAVHGGLLTLDDACARYALTVEEFLAWERGFARYGLAGLRATYVPSKRNPGDTDRRTASYQHSHHP